MMFGTNESRGNHVQNGECEEGEAIKIRSRREVHRHSLEYWIAGTGVDHQPCLEQPAVHNPCRSLQYVVQNKCLNNLTLHVYYMRDNNSISCDKPYVDSSRPDTHSCSLILEGDHEQNTSISCEIESKIQNTSLFSKMLFLPSRYKNIKGIIDGTNFEGVNWLTSLEVRSIYFYSMILLIPNNTILEEVKFYDSSFIQKTLEITDCSLSCKICQFESTLKQSLSSMHMASCNSVIIHFEGIKCVSTNIRVYFLTSIEAKLNDVVLRGNENATNSGSKISFEQMDMIQDSNVHININRLYCNDNQVSKYQNVSSIFTFNLYAAIRSFIAVTFENSVSRNCSKLMEYIIRGQGEISQPSHKDHEINFKNISLLSNAGLSNIIRIYSGVPCIINILSSNFQHNLIGIEDKKWIEFDQEGNPIPKTGVISINTTMANVTVLNCSFHENHGLIGGGLSIKVTSNLMVSTIIMRDNNFINNTAIKTEFREEGQGGALWIQALHIVLDIIDCTFEGNIGHDSGGAVFVGSVTQVVSWWPDYKVISLGKGETIATKSVTNVEPTIVTNIEPTIATVAASNVAQAGYTEMSTKDTDDTDKQEHIWLVYCVKGYRGEKGDSGISGPTGPSGFTGATGPQGLRGYTGIPGATGFTGPMGPPIHISSVSSRNKRGLSGIDKTSVLHEKKGIFAPHIDLLDKIENYTKRTTELENSREKRSTNQIVFTECPQNVTGHPCVRGPKGEKGDPGQDGFPGEPGATGYTGYAGVRGPPGMHGQTGATGATGISGRRKRQVPSPSIQMSDIILKNVTSNSDCQKGGKGALGQSGLTGKKGIRGRSGAYGYIGEQGRTGATGHPGQRGPSGHLDNPKQIIEQLSPLEMLENFPTSPTFRINIKDTIFEKNVVPIHPNHIDNRNGIWSEHGGGGICFCNLYGLFFLQMVGVTFTENQGPMGGAMEISGYAKTAGNITQCLFNLNQADSSALTFADLPTLKVPRFSGGGILLSQEIYLFHIDGTYFKSNKAILAGGGILLYTSKIIHGVTIQDTNFTDNYLPIYGSAVGGGISLTRPGYTPTYYGTIHLLNVIKCNFVNNRARSGAGISCNGNSQGYHSHINVLFEDCKFIGNEVEGRGSGLELVLSGQTPGSKVENLLHLISVTFINNTSDKYGAGVSIVLMSHSLDIIFTETYFEENFASERAAGIGIEINKNENETFRHVTPYIINTTITNTDFVENRLESRDQLEKGGAINIEVNDKCYKCMIVLSGIKVLNSKTTRADGAGVHISLPLWHSMATMNNSTFDGNYAGKAGKGGGIFILGKDVTCGESFHHSCLRDCSIPLQISVENVTFLDNRAQEGGSVYLKCDAAYEGSTIIIRDSTFSCCSEGVRHIAQNSSLIHSSLPGKLENVKFYHYSKGMKSVCPTPDVVFDKQGYEIILADVIFFCEDSRSFIDFDFSDNHEETSNLTGQLKHFMSYCTECKYFPYVFGNGTEVVTNERKPGMRKLWHLNHYHSIDEPCLPCPYGGKCHGSIKARPNYWGYKDITGKVSFATCPQGYCCNDIEVICEEHNTCALHREGRLCGRCKNGYTESLMSRTCVANSDCNDWWVFAGAIFVALTYLMWYTYKSELSPFIEWVILKISTFKTRMDHIVNVEEYKESQILSKTDLALQAYKRKEITVTSGPKQARTEKGYFDILVYFTNIITLLKVKVEFKSGSTGVGVLYSTSALIVGRPS